MEPTVAEKLAAVAEMMGETELKLLDAEDAGREARTAKRSHAARLAAEDAKMYCVQLAVLIEARAWIEAGRSQVIPAAERKPVVDGQTASEPANDPSSADRALERILRAAVHAEDGERR